MNRHAIAVLAATAALFASALPAQASSLRGLGLLAMNDDARGLGDAGRSSLVDLPDSGGGSMGPRAVRGADSVLPARSGGAPAASTATGDGVETAFDPSAPAAQTPKRPSYRWQSLVPGAIK